jgi:carbonic anhydrase
MTSTDQLLKNNETYAHGFRHASLPAEPRLKVAVVACMDCRLDPAQALGIADGGAHVIRNAGGVVTDDVIRSLSISQHELGTEEIILLHHTRCGLQTFTDEEFASARELSRGLRPDWTAGTFQDLDADVRTSIERLRKSPFVPKKDSIRGFVYDVQTGRISEVSAE